ncbi:hypothetical protein DRO60_00610 [Candidatus Bathyarchaeota archaeon]|nr:MAG: hypothetical protein DRO60_00610 [Candidatus Bathyarchaeota archaeon]
MPLWEIPLPVGARSVRLELPDGTRASIRPAFYRPSLEGDVPVLALLAGDNFVGDTLELRAEKLTAAANSIWVDYFAIVPVADGWRRPQDMAHNAMRPVELAFTIAPR